jgi:hypothetical protein
MTDKLANTLALLKLKTWSPMSESNTLQRV